MGPKVIPRPVDASAYPKYISFSLLNVYIIIEYEVIFIRESQYPYKNLKIIIKLINS